MSFLNNFAGAMKSAVAELEKHDRGNEDRGNHSNGNGTQHQQNHAPARAEVASPVNGRKKAVFIGINYPGTNAELRGCVNDVKNISSFLFERYGFRQENSLFLTDDHHDQNRLPTRANIVGAMKWLVKDAREGDSLFIHYSGHGTSVEDKSGDEEDGKDEALVPSDYERAGLILDDEINALLVKPLPRGVRLTAIFDCCHSGTILDSAFAYTVDGSLNVHEKKLGLRHGISKIHEGLSDIKKGDVLGGIQDLKTGLSAVLGRSRSTEATAAAAAPEPTPQQLARSSSADVIAFSGCRDDQTSADAHIGGEATGAMSYALIAALRENPDMSYTQLLQTMRRTLKGKYTQVPQLTSGRHLDLTGTRFSL